MSADYHPDSNPFDSVIDEFKPFPIRQAATDVFDMIDLSKRILLQHKVRNFEACDVIRVTELIFERERTLSEGGKK